MMQDEGTNSLLMQLRSNKHNEYEILVSEDLVEEWVKLTELKGFCESQKIENVYFYFLAFLELAASLCYQRNYIAISAFDPIFPLMLTFDCAKNPLLPFEIRAKFTK